MKKRLYFFAFLLLLYAGCDNNDPVEEPVPELITEVTLKFTTDNGSTSVWVTGTDPDGEGPQGIQIDIPIELALTKKYGMQITLKNSLQGIDVSAEVASEGADHMFFFGFTEGIFVDPSGDGNIDNRADNVNYVDKDVNGLPLGLGTEWTTASVPASGQLRVILKHQPGLKTATSGSNVGETDLDVIFDVIIR